MNEKFKISTWFKNLSDGWKTITLLVGAAITIGTTAIAIDHFKTKVVNANSVIEYLKKAENDRIKKEHSKDSIDIIRQSQLDLRQKHFSDSLGLVYTNTFNLTNAFVLYARKHSATIDDFVNSITGLQFTLIQPEKTIVPSAIIRVEKMDKKKQK
jgi:hypothetical protein